MGMTTEAMALATQLTRAGRLAEATRVIQQALGGGEERQPGASEPELEPSDDGVIDDVPFREIAPETPRIGTTVRHAPRPRAASFTAHVFVHRGHRWRYRLYEPERADPKVLLPVIVMLHGCKQDSEDFARGTRMNDVAARDGFLVLYPEQLRKANQMGCWNWFEPQNQRRDAGEPAMIAALVASVLAQHGGDPQRVYVAGLSAGGAMAATLGDLYPDVFAAVGIHSGLPPRAAHDVQSAFSAMRKGSGAAVPAARSLLPTIVFHGSGDKTVAPGNGEAVVQRQVAAAAAGGKRLERREERVSGARAGTRIEWLDEGGKPVVESWQVTAGPHAWSGGHATGSFTDPQGPSASEAMAAFFLRHRRG
ncbi:extracellular catalytic domain type 1 short-chain-length polyhydroxyalkanoate depolymerase [Ramlibacter sp.]|uniref:extracellular catalytic domain type 1 short-chain-length polyhydroxyalkanoate depolymerase n=1 Tax=Ramlibacter sp. TaxID=1917967 RepID=UPI002FCB6C91